MSVFKDAKLTLITDDGTELNVDVQVEVNQIAEKSPILETYLNNGLSRMRKRDWASYSIAQEDVEQ